MHRRRILYVTGTRAEFGLMERTLIAIRDHARLELQLVVTGMHLSRSHGYTIKDIRKKGWNINATVPWRGNPAQATGAAMQKLADAFDKLRPDIVLVTGDRVEPFAAAAAARIGNFCLAHVHGGDRAQGQLDDSLRHAISKLSHLHFAATRASADRLYRSGEDKFRIRTVGTPGLDDIKNLIGVSSKADLFSVPFALLALHPDTADVKQQADRARMMIDAARSAGIRRGVVIDPNNDPGWQGITRVWDVALPSGWLRFANLSREQFLAHLRSAAVLIGNSSSGIIESASVGTPVINIGDRQRGRERSKNLIDVPWKMAAIKNAILKIWNKGSPRRFKGRNIYGGGATGMRIAEILADVALDDRLMKKLIRY